MSERLVLIALGVAVVLHLCAGVYAYAVGKRYEQGVDTLDTVLRAIMTPQESVIEIPLSVEPELRVRGL